MTLPDPALSTSVSIVGRDRDELGEGPVWDERTARLLRVDIGRRAVISLDPEDASETRFDVLGEVSAVVLRQSSGVLLAIEHEIVALDRSGGRETLAIVETSQAGNRFNDCRCDPQGRLWAGTMNRNRAPGTAALYRMAAGEPMTAVIAPTTLSNGMGWSPGGDRMYFIDSTEQRIDVFDFDGATGAITERRCFATIPAGEGLPDGLAVDTEGGVWVCLFGGGQIRRYDQDGSLSSVVELPVTNPTCPAFGGADLGTLYIPSARRRLSEAQLAFEPAAGAVLALRPGVAGLPAHRFAG